MPTRVDGQVLHVLQHAGQRGMGQMVKEEDQRTEAHETQDDRHGNG
jgi:hypothetical protein